MRPIQFRYNPAYVSATDALSLAFDHLLANLRLWLPATLGYVALSGVLIAAVLGNVLSDFPVMRGDAEAAQRVGEEMLRRLPAFAGLGILLLIGGIAYNWLVLAVAIGGLPGRAMTVDTAISAGVRTLVAGIVGFVLVGLSFVIVTLLLLLTFQRTGVLVPLVMLIALPFGIWLSLRISFTFYAIFDGAGPIDGYRLSWRYTRGAVLRVFGWALLLGAINVGLSIATSLTGGIGRAGVASVLVSTLVTALFQVYETTVMAILYESQRMRVAPSAVAGSGAGLMPVPVAAPVPTQPVDPLAPPPPPPPPA